MGARSGVPDSWKEIQRMVREVVRRFWMGVNVSGVGFWRTVEFALSRIM